MSDAGPLAEDWIEDARCAVRLAAEPPCECSRFCCEGNCRRCCCSSAIDSIIDLICSRVSLTMKPSRTRAGTVSSVQLAVRMSPRAEDAVGRWDRAVVRMLLPVPEAFEGREGAVIGAAESGACVPPARVEESQP